MPPKKPTSIRLKVVLINMVAVWIMSAKLATLDLLKIKVMTS